MNRNIYIYILILFLTGINALLLYQLKNEKNTKTESSNIEVYDFAGEILLSNIKYQLANKNLRVGSADLYSLEGDFVKLRELTNEKTNLFFRFSELNCPKCIEHELRLLSEYQTKFEPGNLVLLGSYRNLRHLKLLIKHFNLNCSVYNIEDGALKLPIEESNIPYYFLMDSSMITKDVFIPNKDIKKYDEIHLTYYSVMFE